MNGVHEKHESKICPRCKAGFTCKVGDVANCQCSVITLSEEERKYLGEMYSDCLCADCMKSIKQEHYTHLIKQKMKWIER